jgi:hypothetical protein
LTLLTYLTVIEFEEEDGEDVPFTFLAVTVKVYVLPDVRPETTIGLAPVPVTPSGEDVAVYVDTGCPPVALAVYETEALVGLRTVAVPMVGD